MVCYFSIPTPANCIDCKYTPIVLFSYFKCSFQYNTWMCVLIVCIIMTEGYGFIIVRDCKNVNMNQKSLRIVLVSVVLFLEDIMLDVLPIKRIWYKLFVVTYFKDRLTIKSINITINRYTRTHVLASLSALITLAYIWALTPSFVKSVTLTLVDSSRIFCALTRVEILKNLTWLESP